MTKPRQHFRFLREDPGFVSTYYRGRDDGMLYCLRACSHGSEYPPRYEFCVCTRDGEPSHTVLTPIRARFDKFVLQPWGPKPPLCP